MRQWLRVAAPAMLRSVSGLFSARKRHAFCAENATRHLAMRKRTIFTPGVMRGYARTRAAKASGGV